MKPGFREAMPSDVVPLPYVRLLWKNKLPHDVRLPQVLPVQNGTAWIFHPEAVSIRSFRIQLPVLPV